MSCGGLTPSIKALLVSGLILEVVVLILLLPSLRSRLSYCGRDDWPAWSTLVNSYPCRWTELHDNPHTHERALNSSDSSNVVSQRQYIHSIGFMASVMCSYIFHNSYKESFSTWNLRDLSNSIKCFFFKMWFFINTEWFLPFLFHFVSFTCERNYRQTPTSSGFKINWLQECGHHSPSFVK